MLFKSEIEGSSAYLKRSNSTLSLYEIFYFFGNYWGTDENVDLRNNKRPTDHGQGHI